MAATIIDGTQIAGEVKHQVAEGIARLKAAGHPVRLTAVIVGTTPAAEIYAARQAEGCRAIGIDYNLIALADDISNRDLRAEIRKLSADPQVTGIMLHLPLPSHIDSARVQYAIDVVKDVEGVNPANIGYVMYKHVVIAPCTAMAAVELIKHTGVHMEGAEAVVVGASHIVGKPIALLLTEQMATVTICHIATRDLKYHTRRADILITAAGKPGLITADHVREGACVIDVGINRVTLPDGTRKTVGDVDFDAVKEIAAYLTPVPGGVGPMTVAMLLKNTLRSAELLAGVKEG
ncbi:MAG: bifunctional 5,10-methylenetetrahydrofolate dehydrogenase/5,10-methenyltetrahydrofolate cyclohydrolase [Burkholderiales bacterium]|nr:bifunctional 5,10-methylenetetrahydrofolate dehydrogenase/5,10-methenyltetrahydrofolate cyclohydrolase [Phycisphaerae bacterium]